MVRTYLNLESFEIRLTPTTVMNVQFGDGTNQRSMVRNIVVDFSEPVTFTGAVASAFTVHRSAASASLGTIGNVTLSATPTAGPTSSVTLTFSGGLSLNSSLVDGIYDFMINAAQVTGSDGALDGNEDSIPGGSYSITGSVANKFFRIFGDGNGDGITTLADFAMVQAVFNVSPNNVFDYGEGDNYVSLYDFAQFRLRFNLTP